MIARLSLPSLLLISLLLTAAACDSSGGDDPVDAGETPDVATPSDAGEPDAGGSPDGGADLVSIDVPPDVPAYPGICREGTVWAPGDSVYVERTEDWGLLDIGAAGTRLSIVDVDGDGWADLLVRRGGLKSDDFNDGGTRHTWLLRNREGAGFEDVTLASHLLDARQELEEGIGRPNQVYAMADIDNDGDMDLYSGVDTNDWTVSLNETSEILWNDGSGVFSLGPEDSGIRRLGKVDMPAGATFLDYDRDGYVDLWIGEHNYDGSSSIIFQQDRLFRGDGAGGFTDVTDELGLTTQDWNYITTLNDGLAHTRCWATAACDLNDDGMPELLSASYGRSPNHLWQSVPGEAPSYLNRSVGSGYAYDDDMTWEDNQFALCYCQDYPDAEGCEGLPSPSLICSDNWNHDQDREPFRMGGNSATTVCADIDNDGDIDLLTTEIRHWWAGSGADGSEVLLNDGGLDVVFERPGDEVLGLAVPHASLAWDEGHMTAAVFDFDNDGWNDIYIGASDYAGNRGLLYHQDEDLSFTELTPEEFFEHNRSHGVVTADFDHDGDLDIAVGHSRARCDAGEPNNCYETQQIRIFENVLGQDGNWLQLRLEGGEWTNRAAIGARVTVTAGGVTQTQEVDGGHGHYNTQKDLVLYFGLGAACEAEVTVRWPDLDLTEESIVLGAGYRYEWAQGERPEVVEF